MEASGVMSVEHACGGDGAERPMRQIGLFQVAETTGDYGHHGSPLGVVMADRCGESGKLRGGELQDCAPIPISNAPLRQHAA